HDRAGRRDCARWQALGVVPARLLSAGARALTPVPPPVPGEAQRGTQPASVLRQSHSARRCPGLRRVSGAAAQDQMGRLFKAPVRGPEAVLAYLSRYTHRVAIANSRLIAFDEDSITVKWKDYRIEGRDRYTRMTLATLSAGGPAGRDRERRAAGLGGRGRWRRGS